MTMLNLLLLAPTEVLRETPAISRANDRMWDSRSRLPNRREKNTSNCMDR